MNEWVNESIIESLIHKVYQTAQDLSLRKPTYHADKPIGHPESKVSKSEVKFNLCDSGGQYGFQLGFSWVSAQHDCLPVRAGHRAVDSQRMWASHIWKWPDRSWMTKAGRWRRDSCTVWSIGSLISILWEGDEKGKKTLIFVEHWLCILCCGWCFILLAHFS